MSENISLREAAAYLREQDDYLILCHGRPDGDALGSAAALQGILNASGKRARVYSGDPVPAVYGFLFDYDVCALPEELPATVVAVDTASAHLLAGKAKELAEKVELLIDHHGTATPYAKRTCCDPTAAATGELIAELAELLQVSPTKEVAAALYTAIAADTGCFLFSNTTARTHRITASLLECGVEVGPLNYKLFTEKSPADFKLEAEARGTLRLYDNGRVATTEITNEMKVRCGVEEDNFDAITQLARSLTGVEIGITLKETQPGVFKASLRSNGRVSAAALAASFGGGGHFAAAGCTLEMPLDQARETLAEAAAKACRETLE